MTVIYFTARSKFGPLDFGMGKAEIVHFSVAFNFCDIEMQSASTPMNAKDKVI